MMEIEIIPGVKIVIDPDKFEAQAALKLAEMPPGDWQLTLDLNLHNVLEDTDQKVQNLVILRSK
jgi:hypothetical protein